ncbi:MAG: hypothetical protein J6T20_01370 [Treponema sp.]|nr:hypothetical protein [Treponema sp.]
MKNCFKLGTTIILLFIVLQLNGCKLFDAPCGNAELLSAYTTQEEYKYETATYYIRYLNATLKITNTGNIDIYNSTVSISCESTEREYYKTVSFDITISPGSSVFIPIQFEFDTRINDKQNEKWKTDSIKITNVFWK